MAFPDDLTPGGPDDLYLLCAELLDASSSALALSRGGTPSRAYVSPGPPAFDCVAGGQLTVHAGGPIIAETLPLQPPLQPAHRVELGLQLNLVQMTVTVIRCAVLPQGQTQRLPDTGLLSQVAAITMADVWAIWNWVATHKRNQTLFPPKERELYMDPAYVLQTQGGAAGWQIPFRVQLNGFRAST